jgi:hypothetical protein
MTSTTHMDSLAFQFFREFARCEYCLKAIGLRENNRNARADWGALATELGTTIEAPETPDLAAAVVYLVDHPPKKQVIQNGLLAWDDRLPDHMNKSELVLRLVCRVRNNLFHGGKFNGHWFEPQRSEGLLKHSLTVLQACVQSHDGMREAYNQKAV